MCGNHGQQLKQRPDPSPVLCRLGVVADIGQTYNSSVTYQHLVADNPDVSPPSAPFLPHRVQCERDV